MLIRVSSIALVLMTKPHLSKETTLCHDVKIIYRRRALLKHFAVDQFLGFFTLVGRNNGRNFCSHPTYLNWPAPCAF